MKNKEHENRDDELRSADNGEELQEQVDSKGTINRTIHVTNNVNTVDNRKFYYINLDLGGKNFALTALVIELLLLIIRDLKFYTWVLDNANFLDTILLIIIFGVGVYLILWFILSLTKNSSPETESVTRGSDTYMRDNFNINQNF